MIDTPYIRSVLERFEGKGITKGYVPADKTGKPFGASGVTIATGLDLGQQSRSSLEGMKLPEEIISRFSPYLGVKTRAAQQLLAKAPLQLSQQEVELVDSAVHNKYIEQAAKLLGYKIFENAPKEVQAVAASLHYQFGVPARKDSPALKNAWEAMKAGTYRQAAACLRDSSGWSPVHRQYLKRRQAEAALLDKVS